MHRRVLTERHFHLSVREPPFPDRDRPAATAPLPADRHSRRITLPSLFHNCRQVLPSRRTTKSPRQAWIRHAVQLHPPDQWQKCRLRADLLPGPAAVRRLLPHAGSARRRSCSASSRGCATARPASVSSTASCRFWGAQGTQPAGILQTTAGRAQVWPVTGASPASPSTRSVPRQHGARRFHQAQPAQSALSAAVATVGGSGSLPVILRPDEVSEALKVGVNELLSLYGIH